MASRCLCTVTCCWMDRRRDSSCQMLPPQMLASTAAWPVIRLGAAQKPSTSPCLVITQHPVCSRRKTQASQQKCQNLPAISSPEPPKMTGSSSPEELSIAVNSPLELECSATGVPPPTLTWLKDGQPLERSDIVQQDGRFVRISKVQVRSVNVNSNSREPVINRFWQCKRGKKIGIMQMFYRSYYIPKYMTYYGLLSW